MGWFGKLVSWLGGSSDPLKTIFEGIDSLSTSEEEKGILKNKAIELHLKELDIALETKKVAVADRSNARGMYGKDAFMQKVFAIVFLIAFFVISWYMLRLYTGEIIIKESASNFINIMFGSISTFMGMIVAFFFGSSAEGNSGKIEKK